MGCSDGLRQKQQLCDNEQSLFGLQLSCNCVFVGMVMAMIMCHLQSSKLCHTVSHCVIAAYCA